MPRTYKGNFQVPSGVTAIAAFAFDHCDGLTGVSIPGSVREIGDYAFSGCENLAGIELPGRLNRIGHGAFVMCRKVNLKLASFDSGKASLSTWIYSITRNSVIDFYRRSHPHEEIDENMAQDGAVDDDMLNDETLEELAEALEKLPAELREIVVLRYYDGMPLTEIAKKMNMSYGMVKLRHNSALELIRRSMS